MKNPLISVIIPCFNCADYVQTAIDSVINQNYPNIELICVNDGSKDQTLQVLKTILIPESIKFSIIDIPNHGAPKARNTGLQHAKGNFIQFLDADDVLTSEKFNTQIKHFDSNIDWIVSDYERTNWDFSQLYKKVTFKNLEFDPLLVAIEKIITTNNPIYRKQILIESGCYNPDLPRSQDWELHIKLVLLNYKVHYVPGIFSINRIRMNSISANYINVLETCIYIIDCNREKLLKYKDFNSNHRTALAKWCYEASLYCENNNENYLKKALFWDEQLQFIPRKKKFLIKLIGLSTFWKIERKRLKKKSG